MHLIRENILILSLIKFIKMHLRNLIKTVNYRQNNILYNKILL
jgi:hypothetical protein